MQTISNAATAVALIQLCFIAVPPIADDPREVRELMQLGTAAEFRGEELIQIKEQ
jgi:hypothetical protein